jgi:hypothetical protein
MLVPDVWALVAVHLRDDLATLRAGSLTCSTLRDCMQCELLRAVHLDSPTLAEHFDRTLQENPLVMGYVRRVCILGESTLSSFIHRYSHHDGTVCFGGLRELKLSDLILPRLDHHIDGLVSGFARVEVFELTRSQLLSIPPVWKLPCLRILRMAQNDLQLISLGEPVGIQVSLRELFLSGPVFAPSKRAVVDAWVNAASWQETTCLGISACVLPVFWPAFQRDKTLLRHLCIMGVSNAEWVKTALRSWGVSRDHCREAVLLLMHPQVPEITLCFRGWRAW